MNCTLSTKAELIHDWLEFVSYQIILPGYLVIGPLCNIVLLVAFYKQSKLEQTYMYQVLLTVSKTMEVIAFGGYNLAYHCFSGKYKTYAAWFQRQYVLMFIGFKIGAGLHLLFVTSSVLLATAMAADRVFALGLPLRYSKIRHSRHQLVAAVICFALPTAAVIRLGWYLHITPEGDHYILTPNTNLDFTIDGAIITMLRFIGLSSLIALNVAMIVFYRRRQRKVAEMTNTIEKGEARKALNRTLLQLNVWQSVLMCVNQIPHFTVVMMNSLPAQTGSSRCTADLMAPLADGFIFITDSVDLAVVLSINKKMRQMVSNAIRCKGQLGTGSANS